MVEDSAPGVYEVEFCDDYGTHRNRLPARATPLDDRPRIWDVSSVTMPDHQQPPPHQTHLPLVSTRERAEPASSGLSGWLHAGGRLDEEVSHGHKTHPWYMVLWLTGVDYFSTLGYQPGIALLAAGALAPVATGILVLVTLFCAYPIYAQVASRSYAGQGSIALLENLLPGWLGKLIVLILLGFAATDFVITMTLSAADAAEHAIHNPYLHQLLGDHLIPVTLVLLAALALVFLKGFNEAIGLAAVAAVPFLILNLIVLIRGIVEIANHPSYFYRWRDALFASGGDWSHILLVAVLIFPRLALGLSGFETGVSVMPLVSEGGIARSSGGVPIGRTRNTKKLLLAAALIMSLMLILSSFVTALLVSPDEYKIGGPASGRAIAYLAHGMLGSVFGTIYDLSTIFILSFAGASAMAGLLHLIPRYLPRFGMAPLWVAFSRPLVLVLFAINIIVTLAFKADVNAQGGAYATGVLVLMFSAAIAAAIALWRERARTFSIYAWGIVAVFAYTLFENIKDRPDGIVIASVFIGIVVGVGAISRWLRSTELRVANVAFLDEESARLWQGITGRKVNLVAVRSFEPAVCKRKAEEIRRHYNLDGPIALLNVELLDNRSEFLAELKVAVREEDGNYHIRVTQATAIANTIAYISELVDPVRLFLGLSRRNLMSEALRYLLFGEGETGVMVYTILVKYWEWTPEDDVRPLIFLMSD
ncbi:MAG: hypothetical protein JJE04_21320 [Acidobacteriia bacterium]|nr:hypothetical protein [Terriglobia bacterium]